MGDKHLNPYSAGTYQNRALQEMFDAGTQLEVQLENIEKFRSASSSLLLNDWQQSYLVRRLGDLCLKVCLRTSNPSMAASCYQAEAMEGNPFSQDDCTNEELEKAYGEGKKKAATKDQLFKHPQIKTMVTIIDDWEKYLDQTHISKPLASYFMRQLGTLARDTCVSKHTTKDNDFERNLGM